MEQVSSLIVAFNCLAGIGGGPLLLVLGFFQWLQALDQGFCRFCWYFFMSRD